MNKVLDMLVAEVETAFKHEEAVSGGAGRVEAEEVTNAVLRVAWPFVLQALREVETAL